MSQKLFNRFSYSQIFKWMWLITFSGLLFLACLFVFVAKTRMPDTSELENPKFEEASIIYSDDMVEIDRYYRKNRHWVQYEELSPNVVNALIATEDHRFYSHFGIDTKGIIRAVAFAGTRGGASTITQQLAKQFFTPIRSRNIFTRLWQKMKEWVIAIEFERRYTKEEIIAMFLNKFDFYYGANGISAAANVYFAKDQRDLRIDEAAMLIGMLKNPYIYNPNIKLENALSRRNVVLAQMKKRGYIDQIQYADLISNEIDLSQFNRSENYKGLAPYYVAELKKYIKELMVKNGINKPGGERYDLDLDGLTIYTTLDTRYQKHAEASARDHMTQLQNQFFNVWAKRDPWTYGAEKGEKQSRTAILNDLVEQSERYKGLRSKFLSAVSKAISLDINEARLWNADIIRMLRAEKNENYLDDLLSKDFINRDQYKTYQKIIQSEHWAALKSQWGKLGQAAKNKFNTPVPMTLYAHNGSIEKTMTPLDSIKYMSMMLQIGSIAMDPHSGYVKAWVGGTNFNYWKYDHVTSNRQVGSTFKPFLYTTALLNGISPCWKVRDVQYTIPKGDFGLMQDWSPKNSRGDFTGEEYTLKEGLRQSMNSVSIWLVKQLGSVEEIINLASDMGIQRSKIPEYPSIVLGSPTLSVLEMTTAYSTFANNGVAVRPIFIKKIEDKNGKTIFEGDIIQKRAIPESINSAMIDLLKYASSSTQSQLNVEYGGKTGTTNDHVDGWFMGVTPNLVVGTWAGGEYSWIRFLNIAQGQGAVMARPFFLNFMKKIEADPSVAFDKSAKFFLQENVGIVTDCDQYENVEKPKTLGNEFDEME